MRERIKRRLAPSPSTHTVRPGETLSSIGALLDVRWPEIARANGLKTPYRIYPGLVLKIPKK
ncbi:LysM domain-containing protein [Streptomyces sp. WAC 01529]|uniref:LysM peptidoglycan-binding domain-containing protein n=1 Tax=Streptomyces sp. WAC 01529 TaxID=2203205 RepID=UPI001F0BFFD9|nr:LysM domain-containing protein [Streptomyces sp. WAC 01529]